MSTRAVNTTHQVARSLPGQRGRPQDAGTWCREPVSGTPLREPQCEAPQRSPRQRSRAGRALLAHVGRLRMRDSHVDGASAGTQPDKPSGSMPCDLAYPLDESPPSYWRCLRPGDWCWFVSSALRALLADDR